MKLSNKPMTALLEKKTKECNTLKAEVEKWRGLYDNACAVGHWPDSTNNGGPAILADEIKAILYNYTVTERELSKVEAELSAVKEEKK